jgi:DNA invertase Pin-like site-specific DNA recombinase
MTAEKETTANNVRKTPRVISLARLRASDEGHSFKLTCSIEAAEAWCARNGYFLEEENEDEARGYSGRNPTLGRLDVIHHYLKAGQIEAGTILIVESLSHLTRDEMEKAIALLMQHTMAGLTVVTLADERMWDRDSSGRNLASFILSLALVYADGRPHVSSDA